MAHLLYTSLILIGIAFGTLNGRHVYSGQQSRIAFAMPETGNNWQASLHASYATGLADNTGYNFETPSVGGYDQNKNSDAMRYLYEPGSSAASATEYGIGSKYASASSAASPFSKFATQISGYEQPSGKYSGSSAEYGQPSSKFGTSGISSEYGHPTSKYSGLSKAITEFGQPSPKYVRTGSSLADYGRPSSKHSATVAALAGNSDYTHLSKYASGHPSADLTHSHAAKDTSESAHTGASGVYSPSQLIYSEGKEQTSNRYGQTVSFAQPESGHDYSHLRGIGEQGHGHENHHLSAAKLHTQESAQPAHSSGQGPNGWWNGWMKGWYDGFKYGGGKGTPFKSS